MVHLEHLPNELLFMIAASLRKKDAQNFRVASKYIAALLRGDFAKKYASTRHLNIFSAQDILARDRERGSQQKHSSESVLLSLHDHDFGSVARTLEVHTPIHSLGPPVKFTASSFILRNEDDIQNAIQAFNFIDEIVLAQEEYGGQRDHGSDLVGWTLAATLRAVVKSERSIPKLSIIADPRATDMCTLMAAMNSFMNVYFRPIFENITEFSFTSRCRHLDLEVEKGSWHKPFRGDLQALNAFLFSCSNLRTLSLKMEGRREEGSAVHNFIMKFASPFGSPLFWATSKLTTFKISDVHLTPRPILILFLRVFQHSLLNIHFERVLLYGELGWQDVLEKWASFAGGQKHVVLDQCLDASERAPFGGEFLSDNFKGVRHGLDEGTLCRVLFDGVERVELHASPHGGGLQRQLEELVPKIHYVIPNHVTILDDDED